MIITTGIPRERVKRETALLMDGINLFQMIHERIHGLTREQVTNVLLNAADLYGESEPEAERFNVKRYAEKYVASIRWSYPLTRENVYFYFKKYEGLRKEVTDRFKEKQRENVKRIL
jgi:hypothetical protein